MYNETTQETIARIQSARRLGCRACIFATSGKPTIECRLRSTMLGIFQDAFYEWPVRRIDDWCDGWLRNPSFNEGTDQ